MLSAQSYMKTKYFTCLIIFLVVLVTYFQLETFNTFSVHRVWRKPSKAFNKKAINVTANLPPQSVSSNGLPRHIPPKSIKLCIGITFMNSDCPSKEYSNSNTAHMYRDLNHGIRAFLDNSSIAAGIKAWIESGNTDFIYNVSHNAYGTPLFGSILHDVDTMCPPEVPFIGYANADIMFNDGLIMTLQTLDQWQKNANKPFLAVGKRSNYDVRGPLSTHMIAHVQSEPFTDNAQDYFILSRYGLDWKDLPPYVIGRRGYDNALVNWAHHHHTLVDLSETVLALHQTVEDGNSAGHTDRNQDKEYNVNLDGVEYDHGLISYASIISRRNGPHVDLIYKDDNITVWSGNNHQSYVPS